MQELPLRRHFTVEQTHPGAAGQVQLERYSSLIRLFGITVEKLQNAH